VASSEYIKFSLFIGFASGWHFYSCVLPVDCCWLKNKCLSNVYGEEQFANLSYPFVDISVPKAQG
jgi:hypothetical protein